MIKKIDYRLLILLTISVFILVSTIFFKNFNTLRREGAFHGPHDRKNMNSDRPVKKWMTSNFINTSYGLPADYLKDELKISNSKYPNITIDKAASEQSLRVEDFALKVDLAIKKFKTEHLQ